MNTIKKGDEVIVIAGKDKGRRGSVLRVFDDERVLVENVNVAKKHTKGNPNAGIHHQSYHMASVQSKPILDFASCEPYFPGRLCTRDRGNAR